MYGISIARGVYYKKVVYFYNVYNTKNTSTHIKVCLCMHKYTVSHNSYYWENWLNLMAMNKKTKNQW